MLVNSNVPLVPRQRWLRTALLIVAAVVSGLLLAKLSLSYAIAACVGTVYVVGIIMDPLFGLGAALIIGPLWAWLMLQPLPIPTHIGQYSLILFILLSIVNFIIRKKTQFALPPLLVPLLLFLFIILLSLWNPVDMWQGFLELAKWVQMVLIYVIVYERLLDGRLLAKPGWMLVGLLGSGLLQACIGLWQFVGRGDGPETFAISSRFYRAYGTFMQPNPYAGFVAMMTAILIGLCLVLGHNYLTKHLQKDKASWDSKPLWLILLILCAGLMLAGLVGSWSKGGWIGFSVAVLVILFTFQRKWGWGFLLVACILVVGWLLYATGFLPSDITSRLAGLLSYTQYTDIRSVGITDSNFSTLERIAHWQAAVDMWRSRFWTGVGLGGYATAYPEHNLPNWLLPLGHAHNIYLNMLAETGTLGLCAYLLFFSLLFINLFNATRLLKGWERGIALGLLGAWTHMAVHNLVDNIMVNNIQMHMGVMLALSGWVIALARQTKAPQYVSS